MKPPPTIPPISLIFRQIIKYPEGVLDRAESENIRLLSAPADHVRKLLPPEQL
jgi:hypothetical protein